MFFLFILAGINVLITCHTDQQSIAEQLQKCFTNKQHICFILTNTTPESIIARANLIRWCDVFIVIISRKYQQTHFCMETINYAKDVSTMAMPIDRPAYISAKGTKTLELEPWF